MRIITLLFKLLIASSTILVACSRTKHPHSKTTKTKYHENIRQNAESPIEKHIDGKYYNVGDIKLITTEFSQLTEWNTYNFLIARTSFLNTCKVVLSLKNDKHYKSKYIDLGDKSAFTPLCSEVLHLDTSHDIKKFFEKHFTPFLIYDRDNNTSVGTFTGYYTITINGSLNETEIYKYPVYKAPKDFDKTKTYFTRKQIDRGALRGKYLEIVWLKDPVDAYLLHIQGSGIIKLDNGKLMNLRFAGKNNREYSSIAKHAKDMGIMKRLNGMPIYDWLRLHHQDAIELFEKNDSFIFFTKSDEIGVNGGSGMELTPLASMAVDTEFIPYGSVLWLETQPLPYLKSGFKGMFLAQDVGSDIKGIIRGDIFFGSGNNASDMAHHTKVKGHYFILINNNSPFLSSVS